MSKGTTIKDALKLWEDKHQKVAAEATVVKLSITINRRFMQQPFIIKLDSGLSVLVKCEYIYAKTDTWPSARIRLTKFQTSRVYRV